ncbi:MAG: NAD(P)H-hydrate dehydratase [Anaerolineaceae bacterium]|nr:NAD(P)H-hydrate dehydratase [Anaerolineaceae bacterium]
MKIVSVEEMKSIEADADAHGLSYAALMRNAGEGIGKWVHAHHYSERNPVVLGLVGSGNNGGDTLVALTYLLANGWQASVFLVRGRQADDVLLSDFLKAGGKLIQSEEDPEYSQLSATLLAASVLLDGILGTGMHLPLDPSIGQVLKFISTKLSSLTQRPQIIAVDCPSGVDCDSGEVATETLHADHTLTLAAAKPGLLTFPAFKFVGILSSIDIGLSDTEGMLGSVRRQVIDEAFLSRALPEREMDAHKGDFGTALLVVGSEQYTGAALLAGRAAYRVGAGVVNLGVVEQVRAAIAGQLPEATWIVLPDHYGYLANEAAEFLYSVIQRADVLLIGCGWGMQETTMQFLRALLSSTPDNLPPLVVDADGLKMLMRIAGWQSQLPQGSVLTPHPGEMAVLTGMTVDEVQADRFELAEHYAHAWNQVVVLKGALTIIAGPNGQTGLIPMATPALARAGTGDVLAGMIAGLMAQGVDAYQASCSAAYLHGMAGMAAAQLMGNTASVLANDIIDCLPAQVSMIK